MSLTNDFKIKYDIIESPFLYKEHFHNFHEIIYIVEGKAQFTISGKEYEADGHSMLFINNFESHKSTIIRYPYKRYYIILSQSFLRLHIHDPILLSIITQRPSSFNHMINLNNDNNQRIFDFFSIIYKEFMGMKKYSSDFIGSMIKLMLINLYRDYNQYFVSRIASTTLQMIDKITIYIENHYMDDIVLEKVAEENNIDMYYLSRLFKNVTGFGFKEYLISQRLSRAKDMLINTDNSITEICMNCGYNNVNHFIRIFKDREKYTPLQYRKNHV